MSKVKRFFILFFMLLNYNSIKAQVIPEWATTYALNYPISIQQNDMVTDKDGNVYITGHTIDTSYSLLNIVTLKYNSSGQILWIQLYDSINYFTKIAVDDSGNVYVSGQWINDLLTIKYNSAGVFQWVQVYNGSNYYNWVYEIITDDSCNVYIVGNSHGDRFTTIKYNSSGELKWVALDGPAHGLYHSFITLDGNGNVYITARGHDTSTVTCNTLKYNNVGIKQWERVYQGNFNPSAAAPCDIIYDPHGFVYVLAGTQTAGDADYAVLKYDTLGNLIWASPYSFSNGIDFPESMAIDKSGNVYVTGSIYPNGSSSDSIATLKLNASGFPEWAKTYSLGYNYNEASDIAIDSLGYVYVAGKSSDSLILENFVTIKYDSLGNEVWIGLYHNTIYSNDLTNSIDVDELGNVYVSGTSYMLNSSGILTIKYSNSVGVDDLSGISNEIVIVYPNPFESVLTFQINQDLKNGVLEIYDALGRKVFSFRTFENKSISVDRGNLSSGIYFFRLFEKNQILATGKICAQ